MDRQGWLLMGLGGAALLYLASKSDTGEQIIEDAGAAVGDIYDNVYDQVGDIMSTIRGIRNNNPGNIRISSIKWQGLSPSQTDGSFLQFASMDYGIRAIAKILMTYQDTYQLHTVRGIINRWAPPSENDTGAYVAFVSNQVGVAPEQIIDVHDPETMRRLIRAIVQQENGIVGAAAISDAVIAQGAALAGVA